MPTGLGWLFGILSRLSKGWRAQCSWGSFSDLLTSLSKQMLDELPCLKWKSPQEILALPHFELTSDYHWSLCRCSSQHYPPALSFHEARHCRLLYFCHVKASRTPPRFPSLFVPCYLLLMVLHAALGQLPCSLTSFASIAPLAEGDTGSPDNQEEDWWDGTAGCRASGGKHRRRVRVTGRRREGWRLLQSPFGRGKGPLWRQRKPWQSEVCETCSEMAGG